MTVKSRSEQIRETIGHLIYEQQLAQVADNDHQYDHIEERINHLREKLKIAEIDEYSCADDED